MKTFFTSLELAAPLLLLIAIGYFLKRIKMISKPTSRELSKLVLNVLLPANIFVSIYNADFSKAFDGKLILFVIFINIVLAVVSLIVTKRFTNNNKEMGAMLQVCTRGNFTIFGLPLIISIYGNEIGAIYAIVASFMSPLFNFYAISVFEHYQNSKANKFKQFINVLKTPLVLFTIISIIIKLLNISLPSVGYKTIEHISKSLTAISLINVGASFNFAIDKKCIRLLIPSILFKLVIGPAIALSIAALLGFRNDALLVIYVYCAVPVAAAAFPTADCYDTDIELTKASIVYSHVFCTITIPLILSILKTLGLV